MTCLLLISGVQMTVWDTRYTWVSSTYKWIWMENSERSPVSERLWRLSSNSQWGEIMSPRKRHKECEVSQTDLRPVSSFSSCGREVWKKKVKVWLNSALGDQRKHVELKLRKQKLLCGVWTSWGWSVMLKLHLHQPCSQTAAFLQKRCRAREFQWLHMHSSWWPWTQHQGIAGMSAGSKAWGTFHCISWCQQLFTVSALNTRQIKKQQQNNLQPLLCWLPHHLRADSIVRAVSHGEDQASGLRLRCSVCDVMWGISRCT